MLFMADVTKTVQLQPTTWMHIWVRHIIEVVGKTVLRCRFKLLPDNLNSFATCFCINWAVWPVTNVLDDIYFKLKLLNF
jgi:hypothetical protein